MKPEREVHGLHTIKRIVVELEHPSGCLHDILTTLYDNFALSKDGFLMWRDDNDPIEQEGKGKKNNLKIVENFFFTFYFLFQASLSNPALPSFNFWKKKKTKSRPAKMRTDPESHHHT